MMSAMPSSMSTSLSSNAHPPAAAAPGAPIPGLLATLGAQVLVRGWLSANNIVFGDGGGNDSEGACVVDTGYVSHAAQTVALVEQALGGQPLHRVLNTHLHSDHCGGNAALARRWPGLQTAVPAGYQAALSAWDEAALGYRNVDQRCERFQAQQHLRPGDRVRLGGCDWQVLAAPGHDPDAILLWQPANATLISGDALWEQRLAIIFPELTGEPGFDAASQVLDLIESLSPRLVLPGHGPPFTGVAAALAASRQRLAAFAKAPLKHRQHAARALVSYHMLEFRARPREALVGWIAATPVFGQALQCAHDPLLANALAVETLDRLLADGVLREQAGWVLLGPD